MLKQIEGSQGVAQAVALCRPDVVCAYPISPQTHIVENLGLLCRKGVLQDCEYINVESEFAAMSVAIGASVAGGPIRRLQARGFFIWPKLSITRAVWAFLLS
jgi:pyruvate ferredoxin oxidoreductase alpha subunit